MTDLPVLPFDRPNPLVLPPLLRKLQNEAPIVKVRMRTGDEAWLITRFDGVRALFTDHRLGRTNPNPKPARPGAETVRSSIADILSIDSGNESEQHAKMRALLTPCFSARRMRALKPQIEKLVDDLLDDLSRREPPLDLITALALPLPIQVICKLLGVDYTNRDLFRSWSVGSVNIKESERSAESLGTILGYLKDIVAKKRVTPGDDLISDLIAVGDGQLDDAAIAVLATIVMVGGNESTARRIGTGALLLLVNPDQWVALCADPTLAPAAVEEILRLALITGDHADGLIRYAQADIEFSGVTIRRGELVLLGNAAANRDQAKFGPAADQFDISRNPVHLDFGHGVWFCIGAALARMEMIALFERLSQRFPTMRLAVSQEEIEWRNELYFHGGAASLPVTW